jgi:hypothetical protein
VAVSPLRSVVINKLVPHFLNAEDEAVHIRLFEPVPEGWTKSKP